MDGLKTREKLGDEVLAWSGLCIARRMTDAPRLDDATQTSFADLGLSPPTLQAIEQLGFERPTPIQAQTIPLLLEGRDLVAQAQTGTGKTAAYGLPLVERLDPTSAQVQALILCPTRELAVQISEALYAFGRPRGIRVVPIYGGQPIDRQLRALRAGVQIVVGTPGRTLDHLRRQTLDLSQVRTVVLDEGDEMLAMGFIEDIETILAELPGERQMALFSATMPAPIARITRRYLRDPSRVVIAPEPRAAPRIRQSYYETWPAQKVDALFRILDMETPGPTIIFCGTRRQTEEVAEHLRGRGYLAEGLHGDMNQRDRDRVLRRFREGRVELLVATDVAARGLDIETVTHVINYDIPSDVEAYTHRIGRTGRAGREGDAITLVSPRERRLLQQIERASRARFTPMRIPTEAEIAVRRREALERSLVDLIEAGELDPYLGAVANLTKTHDASQVAAAALKLLSLQDPTSPAATTPEVSAGPRAEDGMTRLFLAMGRQEGLRPGDLVGAIVNETGLPAPSIGAIDILDHHAFVEVPEARADDVSRALMRTTLRGMRVRVERAPPSAEATVPTRARSSRGAFTPTAAARAGAAPRTGLPRPPPRAPRRALRRPA